jgi:SAM-dependent methyltransferase
MRKKYHYARYSKVKNFLDEDRDLLDIGCGKPCECMKDGSFLNYLGYGIGMDIKNCSIEHKFVKGNLTNIPFSKKTFNTVVAMEVIEHMDDVETSLKNIKEVLKDDGVFIMSTPDNNVFWKFFWEIWTKFIGKMWDGTHKNNLNKKEWLLLLNKYFIVTDVHYNWFINLIFKMNKRLK